MDTLKIKAFLMVEKYKSFSKAAAEFNYTPSALSHMADTLEAELGIKLFHRTPRGVEITDAGRQLREKFAAVAEAERALTDAAAALSGEQAASLRIGTYSSIALHILPEILQQFKSIYPEVKISILVADSFGAPQGEDTADVIFADAKPQNMAKWYPMMEDEYVAVVPADAFPGRRSVQREALYAHAFIRTNESILEDYFAYDKFREIVHLTSVEDASAVSMVKEGIGVAVLPRLVVKEHPRGVRMLRLLPKTTRTLGFAFREEGVRSRAAERFVRFLQESSAQV